MFNSFLGFQPLDRATGRLGGMGGARVKRRVRPAEQGIRSRIGRVDSAG